MLHTWVPRSDRTHYALNWPSRVRRDARLSFTLTADS